LGNEELSTSYPVSKCQELLKTSTQVVTNAELPPANLSTFLAALRPHRRRNRRHAFRKCVACTSNILSIALSKKTFVTLCKAKSYTFLVQSFILPKSKTDIWESGLKPRISNWTGQSSLT